MTDTESKGASVVATDQQDERLRASRGLRGELDSFVDKVRSGDLGVLPVVAGLVVIWAVMQALNSVFLSAANLSNLVLEATPVGVIALGIVFVLLVGQIDLSVGSVSGFAAATTAVLFVNRGWPVLLAIGVAIVAGAVIGWVYAQAFNRFGIPTFVVTLAGLLAFLGLQLYILNNTAINLPFDSQLVLFAQLRFVPRWLSYVLVLVTVAAFSVSRLALARERHAAGLSAKPVQLLVIQAAALLVVLGSAAWFLNRDRGVGWMFIMFVVLVVAMNYVLTRTKWGRSVYAVGGNAEAARRAGINVNLIYTSCLMICSAFAALGGVLAAAQLAAANQGSGGGDVNLNAIAAAVIGGTSLFGGRGTAYSALLGIIVIQSISSGLILLNLNSSFRFMVTGAVLVLAVGLDSVSRRSRTSHGRA